MLSRFVRITAAVLSGVTASLLVGAAGFAQDKPVIVYAGPQENTRTERVSYADLDLAQHADQRKLNFRVAGAVKRVCLFDSGHRGLQAGGYYNCANDAWGDARPQIAQAVATAKEFAMTGKPQLATTAITIRVSAQ